MKKILLTLTLILAAMFSSAQGEKHLYRLYINHADPQYVYRMLAGLTTFNDGPEITLSGYGNGGFGNSGFGGGNGRGG